MEKQQVCESPKITDYFHGSPDKGSCLSESVSKDSLRLEDILPTPETSPVKDKAESKTDVQPIGVSSPDSTTDIKASNNACEKLAERLAEDISAGKAGKENITDNKPNPVSDSSEVLLCPHQRPDLKHNGRRRRIQLLTITSSLIIFPVRRSNRQCVSNIKKDEENRIEDAVLNGKEIGLKVVEFEGKGRGVIATQDFRRGGFVVEYAGDLIDLNTAKLREEEYAQRPDKFGCYMYYFTHKNKNYCVDATLESGRLGRLLNHSKKGNCHTKLTEVKGTPRLILVASRDIQSGEELLYDYGDRSKSSLEAHPWLKS
ncbi:N-lysine methyltransferase KMT5A-like [Liolophura sinensis]|uniref:N-lysine methyltransferase KMT5A-like n=1 Tax=Liolophura sinensis TaxID=3198878 RepID=UPI0031582E29